jgi:WXXGXW repeat (2 copies)
MKKLALLMAALLFMSGISANAAVVSIAIGDQPYYIHGPGYYVGPAYYVWVPGHWRWHHGHRYWVHGHYMRR